MYASFALLFVGCGRHSLTAGCETSVEDPSLQDAWGEWIGAVGPDRVCVGEVRVEEGLPYSSFLGPYVLRVDPKAADPARDLRRSGCTLLNDLEDLLEGAPEAYTEWKYPEEMFIEACSMGPLTWDMTEEIGEACGESPELAEVELLQDVYPNAPYFRADPMELVASAEIHPSDAESYVHELVGTRETLVAVVCADEPWLTCTAERLDAAGGATPLFEFSAAEGATSAWLFPNVGADEALIVFDDGVRRGWWITAEDVVEVDTVLPEHWQGGVSGGVLYTVSARYPTQIDVFTLTTGATETIPLPDHPDDMEVKSLVGVEGGFVLSYAEAEVEVSGDMISIGLGESVIARYEAASGDWTELARGLNAYLTGASGDRLVGAFRPDAGISSLGGVPGVWDLSAGTLLAADSRCASTYDWPDAVTGDTLWWDTDDVLEGFTLSE